jgi:hypothetical protein
MAADGTGGGFLQRQLLTGYTATVTALAFGHGADACIAGTEDGHLVLHELGGGDGSASGVEPTGSAIAHANAPISLVSRVGDGAILTGAVLPGGAAEFKMWPQLANGRLGPCAYALGLTDASPNAYPPLISFEPSTSRLVRRDDISPRSRSP